mgnify:CR=1 FL=1
MRASDLHLHFFDIISPLFVTSLSTTHGKRDHQWATVDPQSWDAVFDPAVNVDEDSDLDLLLDSTPTRTPGAPVPGSGEACLSDDFPDSTPADRGSSPPVRKNVFRVTTPARNKSVSTIKSKDVAAANQQVMKFSPIHDFR